jgi:hypothetical protein
MYRLSILLSFGLFLAPVVHGQVGTETLQSGKTIEKSLAAGQTHRYTINLEKDQFIQLAGEQRGIDVVVRVFAPGGTRGKPTVPRAHRTPSTPRSYPKSPEPTESKSRPSATLSLQPLGNMN